MHLDHLVLVDTSVGPSCTCMSAFVCMRVIYIDEIGACVDMAMLRFISSDILESRDQRGLLRSPTKETTTHRYSMTSKYFEERRYKRCKYTGAGDKANSMTVNVVYNASRLYRNMRDSFNDNVCKNERDCSIMWQQICTLFAHLLQQ